MTTTAPSGTTKVSIEFRPHDKVTRVPPGMTIFNAANWIGLPIDSTCGAKGTCGKCKVRILHGNNGATAADRRIFTEEELADGWRLSCRSEANSDVVCHVPRLMGNPKAALMGFDRHVILNPNVYKIPLTLTAANARRPAQRLQPHSRRTRAGRVCGRSLPEPAASAACCSAAQRLAHYRSGGRPRTGQR